MVLDPSRDPTLQEVRIYLEDINDQPPRFTKLEYTAGTGVQTRLWPRLIAWLRCGIGAGAEYDLNQKWISNVLSALCVSGVAADAKVGSDLIRVQAIDNDIGNNSLILYHILSIRYIKLQSNESEDIGNVFIIGMYHCLIAVYDFQPLCFIQYL